MANLLIDFISYLTEVAEVQGYGIDAFTDSMPNTPDTAISVYEYAGGPPPLHSAVAQRSIQIVVRDKKASVAREKAVSIYNALYVDNKHIDLTEERWALVHLRNTPIKTRVDESNRHYYSFNIGVTTYTD